LHEADGICQTAVTAADDQFVPVEPDLVDEQSQVNALPRPDVRSVNRSLSAVQNAFTVSALTRRTASALRSLSFAISVSTSLRRALSFWVRMRSVWVAK
jgi:uncharacterized protein GlcG (DUF336 family)